MFKSAVKKALFILTAILMIINIITPVEVTSEDEKPVSILFNSKAQASSWSTAVTVSNPDTKLLTSGNIIRVTCDATTAPALILQSWTGGTSWANVLPFACIDRSLYYSYDDMVKAFGTDMSLVNSLHVMTRSHGATIYEIAVVTQSYFDSVKPADKSERRVVGYLPDWSYSYFDNLDLSALTHINIAFCNPDSKGNLSCNIPDAELERIVKKAHANNIRVLASLGGAGGSVMFPSLTKDKASMEQFNQKIEQFLIKYNLDGADLDIEGDVDKTFWDTYEFWVVSLKTVCSKNGFLLTEAASPYISGNQSKKTLDSFDFINVMAYDNNQSTQSHSGYDFAEECLDYFTAQRGVPTDRLVLGVPFYGRGFDESTGMTSYKSYVPFSKLIESDTSNYNKDNFSGIAYNGADTISKKSDLALGYGGIMIWELSQDALKPYSLLDVIKNVILEEEILSGDTDLDSSVTVRDIVILKQYLLGKTTLSETAVKSADINKDSKLNVLDLILLKDILLEQ